MKKAIKIMLIMLAITSTSKAQQKDKIKPNPKAVELKQIWGRGNLGVNTGSIGDINDEGLDDWILRYTKYNKDIKFNYFLQKLFYGVKNKIPKYSDGFSICDTRTNLDKSLSLELNYITQINY